MQPHLNSRCQAKRQIRFSCGPCPAPCPVLSGEIPSPPKDISHPSRATSGALSGDRDRLLASGLYIPAARIYKRTPPQRSAGTGSIYFFRPSI